MLLSNGGAAIALLAFIGNIYGSDKQLPDVTFALGCFLLGIFLGGLAHFTAYMTQLILFNEPPLAGKLPNFRDHGNWLYASLALVVSGVLCFGVGSWFGMTAMLGEC